MAHALAVSDFSFQYWNDSPKALTNVNLTVAPGKICALLGPTNSGKTTLLQAIAGILGSHHRDAIAEGTLTVGDEIFTPMPRHVLFPTVGLTLQDPYYQISGLRDSVQDEIALTLESIDLPTSEIRDRVSKLLDTLGLLHLAERRPSTLSGGELQRVALANILVARPLILLLDEPSHSLDGAALRRLATILCALKDSTTMIVADYQLELPLMVADHFVVLDEGRVTFSGDRAHFIDNLAAFLHLLPVGVLEQSLRILSDSTLKNRILNIIRNR